MSQQRPSTVYSTVQSDDAWMLALKRAVPVGIALFPIGLLFGVLSSQADWGVRDILLMSLIGFTGSGQFALLKFAQGGVGFAVIFLIILCMNLRYVPMALSASRPLRLSVMPKVLMSHFVSDESYAAEKRGDTIAQRAVVRLTIVFFWTSSTVVGVVAASYIPASIEPYVLGLTFPISALLFLLSALNISAFVHSDAAAMWTRVAAVAVATLASIALMAVFGLRYFWIPGIVVSFLILCLVWRDSE